MFFKSASEWIDAETVLGISSNFKSSHISVFLFILDMNNLPDLELKNSKPNLYPMSNCFN